MLYETAARAAELALDIEDLDLRNRRARVRRKGGAVDVIVWQTGTARLLPRLLAGRQSGPVFLTERRARLPLAPSDLDPAGGGGRLSYRRAAELFEQYMNGWTLHQLRHSALTHAAEAGANTSTLLAYSGHTSVASLARYARVSPEALSRWQAGRDLAGRRNDGGSRREPPMAEQEPTAHGTVQLAVSDLAQLPALAGWLTAAGQVQAERVTRTPRPRRAGRHGRADDRGQQQRADRRDQGSPRVHPLPSRCPAMASRSTGCCTRPDRAISGGPINPLGGRSFQRHRAPTNRHHQPGLGPALGSVSPGGQVGA